MITTLRILAILAAATACGTPESAQETPRGSEVGLAGRDSGGSAGEGGAGGGSAGAGGAGAASGGAEAGSAGVPGAAGSDGEPGAGASGAGAAGGMKSCAALEVDLAAELASLQACSADVECGGTVNENTCGCTRATVIRTSADSSAYRALLEQYLPCRTSGGGTCDCPAVDGFRCKDGLCAWNYVGP